MSSKHRWSRVVVLSALVAACAPTPKDAAGVADPSLLMSNQPPPIGLPKDPCDQPMTQIEAIFRGARQVLPLSTARATTRRPTFGWTACVDDFELQVCRDRDCAIVLSTSTVTDATWFTPAADLPASSDVYFWRVRPAVPNDERVLYGPWTPAWEVVVPDASAPFSSSGGTVLDADLDGLADFGVGAIFGTAARVEAGVLHFFSTAAGLPTTPVATLTQPVPQDGATFGRSHASAGDLDGDGFPELVVGANGASEGSGLLTGAAYVFAGSEDGPVAPPTVLPGPDSSAFGFSVNSAGDVNADGYADLIVGAPGDGALKEGAAYVYFGGHKGVDDAKPDVVLLGSGGVETNFGVSVTSVGDLNGDGYGDVAVGESFYAFWAGAHPAGKVFVFYGGKEGPVDPGVELVSPDSAAKDGFGWSISKPTDVNGDGYHDVVVGSGGANGNDGAFYVWYGGPAGVEPSAPDLAVYPEGTNGFFGLSVAASGDLNGDGLDDVLTGETDAAALAGRGHLYLSSGGAPATSVSSVLSNPDPSTHYFGQAVHVLGDADGDGLDDFLIGALDGDGGAWLYPSDGTPVSSDAIALGPVGGQFGYVGH